MSFSTLAFAGNITTRVFIDLLGFIYLLILIWLASYGVANLINTFLYLRVKKTIKRETDADAPKVWPFVTVQLPIFNEKYTAERLLHSITQLDYPADHMQIQVVDDSTDDTSDLLRQLVSDFTAKGIDIQWIHRSNRKGYKAGALAEALSQAKGELIGVFDADFIPKADWLQKTVPLFQESRLGCLQTRWGHTNRNYNALTRAQAMAIDGHFIIEQSARSRNDLFLNFNGTAGLWRRACIEDAGGWQWDTLTEDLDLSYRAQLRGWKIGYAPDVVVPAELPSEVEAFKKQQFRWAKGSFQVVRKMLPKLLHRDDLPWKVRFMAFLHLTGYMVHPLMLALLLLTLPVGLLVPFAFRIFPFSVIAGFGPPLLYLFTTSGQTPRLRERLKLIPLMTITGFGISFSTSIAVLQGLSGRGSGKFVRTPKLNQGNQRKGIEKIDQAYIEPISPMVWVEIALGFYALLTGILLAGTVGWAIIPWMLIYTAGYLYIAVLNLIQHIPKGIKINSSPFAVRVQAGKV